MWWTVLCVVLTPILGILLLIAALVAGCNHYWRRRNYPTVPASIFWKDLVRLAFGTKSSGDIEYEIYKHVSGKGFGGVTEVLGTTLWITEPELIKTIMVKDFDHFVDRPNVLGSVDEYTHLMVPNLSGEEWKTVRNVLSPTFTSGKMKRIFSPLVQYGDHLKSYFAKKAEAGEEIELKDAYGRFSMDVMASTAFGIHIDSFKEPNALFPSMMKNLSSPGPWGLAFMIALETVPNVKKMLQTLRVPMQSAQDSVNFFASVVKDSVAARDKSGIKGNDFLQLLLDARKGELQDAENDSLIGYDVSLDKTSTEARRILTKKVLTEPLLIAQSILFLLAGLEGVAGSISFTAYQLALNPDIQEKLYEEVKEVADNHGGTFTYDSIMNMEFLDKVFQETLRLHPVAPRYNRTCTRNYRIPNTDYVIEKGTVLTFPAQCIHMDKRHFPNPTKFDPERFRAEEKTKRHPYAYLPFGHGPRNCLGMRFALMEAKAALAMTVLNFRFHPSKKTGIPLKYDIGAISLKAINGVWLKVEKRY